jgi:hypothetical protein
VVSRATACDTGLVTVRLAVGDATLVRVSYADLPVDPEAIGLTADQVTAIPWATPTWAEGHQPRAAAAAWVIESGGRRIVVDPAQAVDAILRAGPDAAVHQQAFAAALDAAGYPRDSIDTVIASHIDGIGMIAWLDDDRWSPFFPNSEVLLSQREYDAIADDGWYRPSGAEALLALHEQGAVTTVGDAHVVTDDVTIRWTGAHSPGHQVVHISSQGEDATMIGHLALSPLHCVIDECANHVESDAAVAVLMQLRDQGNLLIGPLWPAPGAARWTGTEMQPAG